MVSEQPSHLIITQGDVILDIGPFKTAAFEGSWAEILPVDFIVGSKLEQSAG